MESMDFHMESACETALCLRQGWQIRCMRARSGCLFLTSSSGGTGRNRLPACCHRRTWLAGGVCAIRVCIQKSQWISFWKFHMKSMDFLWISIGNEWISYGFLQEIHRFPMDFNRKSIDFLGVSMGTQWISCGFFQEINGFPMEFHMKSMNFL